MEYLLENRYRGNSCKGGIVRGLPGRWIRGLIVYEKIDAGGSATSIIKGILRVITALKKGRSENEWRGIGIAIPGPFDYTRGIAAIHGVRKFDALFGLDLKEEIKRVCSLPVVFLNDASAYALGEYYGGAAQGSERSMV
ncbi:MAG: ROK family protein, partial [Odoribacter splanchnicus]